MSPSPGTPSAIRYLRREFEPRPREHPSALFLLIAAALLAVIAFAIATHRQREVAESRAEQAHAQALRRAKATCPPPNAGEVLHQFVNSQSDGKQPQRHCIYVKKTLGAPITVRVELASQ